MAISSRALIIAATLCLAACKPAAPPENPPATTASEDTAVAPSAAVAPAAAPASVALPAVTATDDDFVGWYFEQGGVGMLQACGQSVPLQVADPTFLRELKGKLGSAGLKPIYARLRVRLAPGSKLEVTQVQQFGVDETPVTNCVLVPPAT